MTVQISQVYQFTDSTQFDARKLQWELNSIANTINNANAGLLTWDNVKVTTLTLTSPLSVAQGGTGQSSYTDGQLLIGNSSTGLLTKSTLTGTPNQVTVTNGNGSITLAGPQNLNTGASPTFAGLTLSGALAMGSNKITGLANGSAATDAAAYGQLHLLQIPKYASETTGGTTTSTSFVNAGASVSITPTVSTSTMLIFIAGPINNSSTGQCILGCNGTTTGDLVTTGNSPYRMLGTTPGILGVTGFFKDTPGTTTAQTYRIRLASSVGTNTAAIGGGAATGASTFILVFEVA